MAVAASTNRTAVSGSEMLPNSTTTSVPARRNRSIIWRALGFGCERAVNTSRPQPAPANFDAKNRPSPPTPPVMM